jgi:GNAT superfamily N-acetyltransferase
MTDTAHARGAIRVLSPTSEDDWQEADLLIAELKAWDLRQSQALGFDPDEVMSVFYPDDGDIRRDSARPDGCFLLARDAHLFLGCAAFRRLTSTACELYDVYVRPTSRGRGIGLLLLQQLIAEANAGGYHTMCLETAKFMHDAHRLYKSLQFHVREPYRSIPVMFAEATMWMECRFSGQGSP